MKVLREVTEEKAYETRQISDLKYIMNERDKREIEENIRATKSLLLPSNSVPA